MKIAVIGGGSTYTPELLHGLVARGAALGVDEVVLQDPRPERVGPVSAFCARMAAAGGAAFSVRGTADRADALDGADFVVIQIRVGGQEGRHEDIQLGLRHGLIGQETTGVGGFAKALRTIPAVLEIARDVEARCPDAWILNFTNPSGIVTEALLRHGRERCVGLCNVPIEMHMEVAKLLGVGSADVALDWVGLNHLGWVRRVLVRGNDVLPGFIDQIEAGVSGPANIPEIAYPEGFLRALGAIPSSYARYFYCTQEMLSAIRQSPRSRAEEVMEIEEQLLAIYGDGGSDELPVLLSERGGAWYSRLAVDVLGALCSDTPTTHIVNTANRGTVPDLPADAVVEVPCAISRAGVFPEDRGAVDESMLGLIRAVKAYERLTIDAATGRDRDAALMALVANPLVPEVETAKAVLDDIVARGLI